MILTEQEKKDWTYHPVTKEFFKILEGDLAEAMESNNVDFDSIDYTALMAARTKGYIECTKNCVEQRTLWNRYGEE